MKLTDEIFECIYREHFVRLYRLAFSILHDEEESRDVVNDVFMRLLEKSRTMKTESIGTYLVVSVRNSALKKLSHRSVVARSMRLYPIELSLYETIDDELPVGKVSDIIANEFTPRTREVFDLVFGKGCSYREAAKVLGVSVSAINKHISVGLKYVREQIDN